MKCVEKRALPGFGTPNFTNRIQSINFTITQSKVINVVKEMYKRRVKIWNKDMLHKKIMYTSVTIAHQQIVKTVTLHHVNA